jgi:membrane fusion protein, heavy metal efflux system
MTRVLCLAFVCALLPGCRADLDTKTSSTDSSAGIKIDSELIRAGQLRVEPVTAQVETVSILTYGKASFNQDRLSYVSSPLAGRIVALSVRAGEHVDAGHVLATIDSADLGAASSEFIKARADLLLSERSFNLAQELLTAKAMARKDFQKAEDDYTKAKVDLRRTRERLLSLGLPQPDLDGPLDALHVRSQLELKAPISGTVVDRDVTLGQMVGGDTPQRLFVIAELSELWVTADVYEKDLPLVHTGEAVSVRAAAWPAEEFTGQIDYVGDTVDANSRTVKIRATVDNRRLLLKPEMFVTAAVRTTGTISVLSVPLAALHGEGSGQPFVFVAAADDRFVRRSVTLGAHRDDAVVITTGLSPQDRVVTEGSILLKAEADRQSNS